MAKAKQSITIKAPIEKVLGREVVLPLDVLVPRSLLELSVLLENALFPLQSVHLCAPHVAQGRTEAWI